MNLTLTEVIRLGLARGELAKRMKKKHPEIVKSFTSGYTGDSIG